MSNKLFPIRKHSTNDVGQEESNPRTAPLRLSGSNTVEQSSIGDRLPPATHQYIGTTRLHDLGDYEVE